MLHRRTCSIANFHSTIMNTGFLAGFETSSNAYGGARGRNDLLLGGVWESQANLTDACNLLVTAGGLHCKALG